MLGLTHIAPSGRRHGYQAVPGSLGQQGSGHGGSVALAHGVGQGGITKIRASLEVVNVQGSVAVGPVVEHGPGMSRLVSRPSSSRMRRARESRETAWARSTPCAMTLATNES